MLRRGIGWSMVVIAMVVGVAACSRGVKAPADSSNPQDVLRRLDAKSSRAAFGECFPPSAADLYISNGEIRLERALLTGRDRLRFSLYSPDDEHYRFIASFRGDPVLDVIRRGLSLSVVMEQKGKLFTGEAAPEPSAIAPLLGWDPADLVPALQVGRLLATADLAAVAGSASHEWRPATPAAGLEWVRLDQATGLPIQARWSRGGRSWTVSYREWDRFESPAGGDAQPAAASTRLMPRRVEAVYDVSGIVLKLEMKQYRFGQAVPERIWTPFSPYELSHEPLSALGGALK